MRWILICRVLLKLVAGNIVYEFDTVIVQDETGGYVAFVPALPGCHTQGDTLQELVENMKEAIELYLETLTEDEKKELHRQRVVGIQKVKAFA
jgi:predicted RNase H-like HicB family nuclease